MKRANCRKCIHFIPVEEMSEELIERAFQWIERNRPGETLLGWCRFYRRPVTYFTGSCPGFRKRTLKQRTLMEYR